MYNCYITSKDKSLAFKVAEKIYSPIHLWNCVYSHIVMNYMVYVVVFIVHGCLYVCILIYESCVSACCVRREGAVDR